MYRRIAIVGAGPMGASLAALTSAKMPTVLVARDPRRAKQIRESGVRVTGMLDGFGWPEVVESIANAAGNPMAAILGEPLGRLLGSPAEKLIRRLLEEGLAVARAVGIVLDDAFVEVALKPMSPSSTKRSWHAAVSSAFRPRATWP